MEKRRLILIWTAALIFIAAGCNGKNEIPEDEKLLLIGLRTGIIKDMEENLLPFWKRYPVDHEDPEGGFFGAIENDGTGVATANKHNVLFTRYLWTYSAAYRVLGDDESLALAHRAWKYISTFFWDMENGGIYWELNSDGSVSDTDKITYGLAFAIYSFSEYHRITKDPESLEKAVTVYRLLEEHALDKEHGGYLEAFDREWNYIEGKGVAAGQPKSMNTHLHLLEAFTGLYRIWPDERLEESLYGLAGIFLNHILDTVRYHQDMFFSGDWVVYGSYDSYGHDIEFSWLFCEAARMLGDSRLINQAEDLAVRIASRQLAAGMNDEGAMIYERVGEGNYRRNISWWVQAEAVVGFLNAHEISGERKFLDAAAGVWGYIKENMIDHHYGGWIPDLDEFGNPRPNRLKGNAWTGPYHNVRMGLEVYERFNTLK